MFDAYINALRRSFDFHGRTALGDYWSFQLFVAIFGMSVLLFDWRISGEWNTTGILFTLFLVAHIPAGLSSGARRLHDVNKSGWMQLIYIVPGGVLYMLFLLFQPSEEGANRFGPPIDYDGSATERELIAALDRSDDVMFAGIEKLEQLARLRSEGVVDEAQYLQMRSKILEIIGR
ncbi:MAG: DUF805 domain-containing protein [Rhizobiaceae bacterium]|nr:DUF805 domain-containing protein [Rhizobiaceae bacterium]